MEEKLEAAYGDQKRIFLIIFQRFIMILSEHLVKCDTDGKDFNTDWYRWTIGRLQQVFLVVSIFLKCIAFEQLLIILNLFYLLPSITNKFRNIRAHWKACSSHKSILTYWMFSCNLLHLQNNQTSIKYIDKIIQQFFFFIAIAFSFSSHLNNYI